MSAPLFAPPGRGMAEEPGALWRRLRGKTALIVGFTARTGFSAAVRFHAHGIQARVSDHKDASSLESLRAKLPDPSIPCFFGPQSPEQLAGVDFLLLSPGVPRNIPLVAAAVARGLPVYNDVDFIAPFIADKVLAGVTGTDGKTTTTELLAHVLSAAGPAVACGNNGLPVFEAYERLRACRFAVLELSSYMLEDPKQLAPDLAVITNLAPDHLDRYAGMEAYGDAKRNLLRHAQPSCIYAQNMDNTWTAGFAPGGVARRTFSRERPADYRFEGGAFAFPGGFRFPYGACLLKGVHNIENILAVMALAEGAGMAPAEIAARVQSFPGLPHRLAPVAVARPIQVFNDSKATTLQAVHRALESFSVPVVLIAGGRGKGLDYRELGRHANLRSVVCYGEEGPRIAGMLAVADRPVVGDFREAVRAAWGRVREGEVLLLSPGCTSWDQHADYAERGRVFCDEIGRLDRGEIA